MKKILSVVLSVIMIISALPFVVSAAEQDVVILYTNDVHCAIDDYAVLAAYRAELISKGNTVITVDAGDFVADAYRDITGADVAIANGGGVRSDIEMGSVSRKNLMDVNAFNNDICVLEVTGQQLVDVLEHGARECPDPIGGFFQVSGVTFEIHT